MISINCPKIISLSTTSPHEDQSLLLFFGILWKGQNCVDSILDGNVETLYSEQAPLTLKDDQAVKM